MLQFLIENELTILLQITVVLEVEESLAAIATVCTVILCGECNECDVLKVGDLINLQFSVSYIFGRHLFCYHIGQP